MSPVGKVLGACEFHLPNPCLGLYFSIYIYFKYLFIFIGACASFVGTCRLTDNF